MDDIRSRTIGLNGNNAVNEALRELIKVARRQVQLAQRDDEHLLQATA